MAITFTKAYVANGKTYATLEEAQEAELVELFKQDRGDSPLSATQAANVVLLSIPRVLDILTTTDASRPMARKVNGGKKTRKPKSEAVAQPELPSSQAA